MDTNKHRALVDIGYRVMPQCRLCVHFGEERGKGPGWGSRISWSVCTNNTYKHLKHSGKSRTLGVNGSGYCNEFTLDSDKLGQLESYREFFEGF